MNAKTIRWLVALGFDKSTTHRVSCSQCEALVINQTPCHEHGCPNARRARNAAGAKGAQ